MCQISSEKVIGCNCIYADVRLLYSSNHTQTHPNTRTKKKTRTKTNGKTKTKSNNETTQKKLAD